jgi:hypothetical protein
MRMRMRLRMRLKRRERVEGRRSKGGGNRRSG